MNFSQITETERMALIAALGRAQAAASKVTSLLIPLATYGSPADAAYRRYRDLGDEMSDLHLEVCKVDIGQGYYCLTCQRRHLPAEHDAAVLAGHKFDYALTDCDADWGNATSSQRCTLAAGHDSNHIDSAGHAWGWGRELALTGTGWPA